MTPKKTSAISRRAIACDAEFFEAYHNLGLVLKDAGRVQEAIHCYHQCLSLQPDHPQIPSNLGIIFMELNMMSAATQCFKASLAVSRGFSTPFNNLALIYAQQKNYAQALSCFNEVRGINPMSTDGLVSRGNTYIGISRVDEAIQDYTRAIALRPTMEEAHAFLASAYMTSGNAEAAIKSYRQALMLRPDFPEATCCLLHTLQMSVIPSVQPFQATAYPLDPILALDVSPNDDTERGTRIQSEAEHFIDVSSLTFDATARMINEDQIEILIDLNGYTKGEEVRYLPCSQLQSRKNFDVLDPKCQPKRSDYGLPEDKFIFACFDQLYKMDPEIFITWFNILKRVPNSVLWLLRSPAAGEMRLRAYAAAQGLQPDQIIFTDVAMKQEHIRRNALADLFLDAPLCNAHTAATDVLWASLPMITLPLEKMATRVAGSLCLATGHCVRDCFRKTKFGLPYILQCGGIRGEGVSLALNRPKLHELPQRVTVGSVNF
ncbi:hypothetical protein HAX54_000174 [Datura stramonium]|uniref:protein O-GlcNAc transferase n=1 Tax=Datura stramonium TaxID=4076 RepID=A0ABS8T2M4_DATST|nr:hypothetical protein [Datura stramonium]